MTRRTPLALCIVAFLFASHPTQADDKKPELTPTQFRRLGVMLLEDPLNAKAQDVAKLVMMFVMESPDVAVFVTEFEMKVIGKDDRRSLPLMAAFFAGNAQSQLHSGVKRNDRYAGLLYLFQVYRRLQEADKDFKIVEIDELLKLHKDEKLQAHLSELEKKLPTKLTPELEAELKKRLKGEK